MPGIALNDAYGVMAHSFVIRLLYLVCAVSALGLQLIAVVSTTLLSMLGPGLALRGPDGSMARALAGMYAQRKLTLRLFGCGLFFILCNGIFVVKSRTRLLASATIASAHSPTP